MLRIGYICDIDPASTRASPEAAELSAQAECDRTALIEAGCRVIRIETVRPSKVNFGSVLNRIVEFAERGDEIVVTRLNQISNSSAALLSLLHALKARGVGLRLLDAGLNPAGLVDEPFIQVLELICSLDGRAANRPFQPHGGGRRNRVTTDDIRSLQARGMSAGQIAEMLNVSRMTIWRKLKQA